MKQTLPLEITEFEQLLRKPNSDPTGFAGFFNSGEVYVARVPARLEVPDDCAASGRSFRYSA